MSESLVYTRAMIGCCVPWLCGYRRSKFFGHTPPPNLERLPVKIEGVYYTPSHMLSEDAAYFVLTWWTLSIGR